jgi:hypothetical protein
MEKMSRKSPVFALQPRVTDGGLKSVLENACQNGKIIKYNEQKSNSKIALITVHLCKSVN